MFEYQYPNLMYLSNRRIWLMFTLLVPLNITLPSYGQDIAIEVFNDSSVFTDTDNYWANLCLEGMGTEGLMRGYPNRSFQPNGTMTRAEFAAVMIQAFPNAPKLREAPEFIDVADDFWGKSAIATAYEKGFLTGYPDNVFKPAQPISRVQAVVVLANAQKLLPITNSDAILQQSFDDAALVPTYAKGLTAAATQQALVVNYPKVSELRPNNSITRGEAAALLCRLNSAGTDARYFINDQYIANFGGSLDNIALPKSTVLHNITTGVFGLLHTHATLREKLFFFIGDNLWESDGTPTGTQLLSRIETIESGIKTRNPKVIAASDQRFWITADAFLEGSSSTRLLSSDGTTAGTVAVATLHPDLPNLFNKTSDLFVANDTLEGDRLPFIVNGETGLELWVTDGQSTVGTQRLATFDSIESAYVREPIFGKIPVPLTVSGKYVFFQATLSSSKSGVDPERELELWRSDGTVEGTISLGAIAPIITSIPHSQPLRYNPNTFRSVPPNRVYFQAKSSRYDAGLELWTSDGTSDGTQRWLETEYKEPNVSPKFLAALGDRFFTLGNFPDGLELWVSQGTDASSQMVKRLSSERDFLADTSWFAIHEDKLFFTALVARPDSSEGTISIRRRQELWVTEGTPETTIKLGDVRASGEGVTAFKGKLFFSGMSETGSELWTTDGTAEGTYQVMDLVPGVDSYRAPCAAPPLGTDMSKYCLPDIVPRGSYVRSLTVHGNFLYFIADDGDLFRTDGTGKNIQHVRSFIGSPFRDFPANIVKVNETLFVMGHEKGELLLWALPKQ